MTTTTARDSTRDATYALIGDQDDFRDDDVDVVFDAGVLEYVADLSGGCNRKCENKWATYRVYDDSKSENGRKTISKRLLLFLARARALVDPRRQQPPSSGYVITWSYNTTLQVLQPLHKSGTCARARELEALACLFQTSRISFVSRKHWRVC